MAPRKELESALRRRAQGAAAVERARSAIASAEETISRARVLTGGRRLARDPGPMMRRCAWCERVTLGGEWLEAGEAERLVGRGIGAPELSHTICPDCSERLKREGKSH